MTNLTESITIQVIDEFIAEISGQTIVETNIVINKLLDLRNMMVEAPKEKASNDKEVQFA